MIEHYDLFAGIGGFSLALEEVFNDTPIKHIFCEWGEFPTRVLKEHWPDGEYWGDITDLVANAERQGLASSGQRPRKGHNGTRNRKRGNQTKDWTIVTGGFPCQPFSHAGRRKGTADDRYQWPNMFAVIRNIKPDWVIAENVRGLITWNEGLVLEQVCTDLESEGYEVQPLIIPAVAVNAPHRRDRIWIIGHTKYTGQHGTQDRQSNTARNDNNTTGKVETKQPTRSSLQGRGHAYPDWNRQWQEVAFATCNDAMDDGLPRTLDRTEYSFAKWRKESLKAYGNAIVPEVALEIFKAIREVSRYDNLDQLRKEEL